MIPVGIVQREVAELEVGELRDALDARWHRFLSACGIVAVPLANEASLAVTQMSACNCRGLILSGGDDPARPGEPHSRRDRTEAELYAWAKSEGLPVLGVCRGMQFLILASGGALEETSGHVATMHAIEGPDTARTVNSFHRYAASTLPENFEQLAAAGRVVEAMKDRERPIYGIMWHPERATPFDPADIALFRTFFGDVS